MSELSQTFSSSVMVLQSLITLVFASSSVGHKSPAQLVCFQHITNPFLLIAVPLANKWVELQHQSWGSHSKNTVWQNEACIYRRLRFLILSNFYSHSTSLRTFYMYQDNLVFLSTFRCHTLLSESSLLFELCHKSMSSEILSFCFSTAPQSQQH